MTLPFKEVQTDRILWEGEDNTLKDRFDPVFLGYQINSKADLVNESFRIFNKIAQYEIIKHHVLIDLNKDSVN